MLALDKSQLCIIRPKSEGLRSEDRNFESEKISDNIIKIFHLSLQGKIDLFRNLIFK